jgi:pantoate--beta-alanine ligase
MKLLSTHKELHNHLSPLRNKGDLIGFVPTMGALHEGHLSLIREAKKGNDIVVCSIFVNPIQFNNAEDLKKYPRQMESDIEKLESVDCDVLFTPSEQEMYPEPPSEKYDFGLLETVMEGKHRPGHFNGVGIVVKRLFEKVNPHKAYFGQKDFQQLAIIRKLTKDLELPIEIISCPIVREPGGLAMSSRNQLLSDNGKKHAEILYTTLINAKKHSGHVAMKDIILRTVNQFNKEADVKLEYFEIVDMDTLLAVDNWGQSKRIVACIAAYVENVRLIDNIILFS